MGGGFYKPLKSVFFTYFRVDIFLNSGMLFFVMGMMKDQYIDYLNKIEANLRDTQDMVRELKQHDFLAQAQCEEEYEADDFASPTHEDCGWFGYEGLCED